MAGKITITIEIEAEVYEAIKANKKKTGVGIARTISDAVKIALKIKSKEEK